MAFCFSGSPSFTNEVPAAIHTPSITLLRGFVVLCPFLQLDPQSYPDSNYASPRPRVSGFRRFQLLQSTTVTLSTNVLGSGTSYFSVASINAGGVGSWSAATMVVVPDFSATTVVYVSPGGSDASSTGSQENPFLTLERAIQYIDDQVQTLGAILLQPGVYNVGSGFTISARQISIRPADSSDGTPGNHIIKCVSGSATSSPLFTVSGSGALSLQALVIQDCEKSTNGAGTLLFFVLTHASFISSAQLSVIFALSLILLTCAQFCQFLPLQHQPICGTLQQIVYFCETRLPLGQWFVHFPTSKVLLGCTFFFFFS